MSGISEWIIYNNNQLIGFNKPAGIPIQDDKTGDKSLKALGEIYCKHPLYLIHRIDRPVSGVILFAKNKKAAAHLSKQFSERKVEKSYLAIIGKVLDSQQGELKNHLQKNAKLNKSFVQEKASDKTSEAILKYQFVKSSDKYHLYEVNIVSGKHHQIRAQLAHLDAPIKGDVKYGFRRSNKDRSIDLHSWKLNFQHPISKEKVALIAPLRKNPLWDFFNE